MQPLNEPSKRATEAFISESLFDSGMGYAAISRFKSDGRVEAGVFLLDIYCLGVKDAFFTQIHQSEYEERFLAKVFRDGRQAITPPCARKLIEDAVAYARALGLAAHPDYKKAARVLGGISVEDCPRTFTFGKDGKPFYIQGPNDSAAKAQLILNLLRAKCGEGNFDFLMVAGEPGGFFDE